MAAKNGLTNAELRADEKVASRSGGEWTKRVNVDFPIWAVKELDRESDRRGITRQALIKMWLIDKLDALKTKDVG